jgi:Cu-processing system permease protein
MNIILKIIRYELNDLIRSKWLLSYGLFFGIVTDLLFRFGSSGASVVVSLMNIVLIIIPLVSLIFGMIYLYNSREFMELLLTQPIDRKHVFLGMFLGLSVPLSIIYLIGIYLPLIYIRVDTQSVGAFWNLGVTGMVLTIIFTAIAFYISTIFEDKIKGLGLAVLLWLFFIVIYDGIILIILFLFADYPLDNVSIIFSLINPVNLGRIFLLLQLDISALMGYTGAVFSRFFGSSIGIIVSLISMLIWIFVPMLMGQTKFLKKDF